MADRNRSDNDYRNQDNGDRTYEGGRQHEQYEDSSGGQQGGYTDQNQWGDNQMGEPSRGGADFYYEEVILVPRRTRSRGSGGYSRDRNFRDRDRGYGDRDYDRSPSERGYSDRGYSDRGYSDRDYGGYGRESGYGPRTRRRYANFTSEDQGGRDFNSPTGRWAPRYGASPSGAYAGEYDYDDRDDGFRRPQYSDRPHQRDWWDRTTDEVASWFGDEEASRRREMDHRGRGPSDYTRSDERIREDVSDNLTDDWAVDARNVRVKVENGEVTLDGTVATRLQKRRAEDCAEDVSGVTHVQNNLRIADNDSDDYRNSTGTSGTTSSKTS